MSDQMAYARLVYKIVSRELGGLDSIYENAITELVGTHGLTTLKLHGYLETCGVNNGRQLYVLVKKE